MDTLEALPMSTEQRLGYRVFALVYQNGLANVFECRTANYASYGREAKRLKQGSFSDCEMFVQGILVVSDKHLVFTAHCNEAGDISNRNWSEKLSEAPFYGKFCPVFHGYKRIV